MNQFDKYQKWAIKTSIAPKKVELFCHMLGLAGEVGETAEKVKKVFRDREGKFSKKDIDDLTLELGDVLWYLVNIADELGISFKKVVDWNVNKLNSRMKRGKLGGSGDKR